jgi:hypothetical protein
MSHVRKQIRDALATQLTGLATTGSRVFKTRLYPIGEAKLPAILIYANSESASMLSIGQPRLNQRTLDLSVECVAKATSSIEDTLDQMALEVEEAIYTDVTLGGLTKDVVLSTTEIEISAEGDQPVGGIRLNYLATYAVKEDNPDVAV